jgi:hypothetical protein
MIPLSSLERRSVATASYCGASCSASQEIAPSLYPKPWLMEALAMARETMRVASESGPVVDPGLQSVCDYRVILVGYGEKKGSE